MTGWRFVKNFFKPSSRDAGSGGGSLPVRVESLSLPALIVDRNAVVMAANGPGDGIARGLSEEGAAMDALRRVVNRVAHGARGRTEIVELPPECGGGRFELSMVPVGNGLVLILGRDLALDHNLRDALVESRQRYKDLVEISSDFVWETDDKGQFVFVSPAGALGWSADQLVDEDAARFVVAGPDGGADAPVNPFLSRRPVQDAEVWFKRVDGTIACLWVSVQPLTGLDGAVTGARGVCRDVTEDRERDAALAQAHSRERLFGYIIRTMRDEVEPESMMTAAATAIARALTATETGIYRVRDGVPELAASWSPENANGAGVGAVGDELIGLAIGRKGVVCVEGDDGFGLAVAMRYRGAVNGVLRLFRDPALGPWSNDEQELATRAAEHLGIAMEQVSEHEQLQTLSRTDGLTGLLNRRSFLEDMARRHARVRHGGETGCLVYCDLDNFKQVNDTHGHDQGDRAIREMATLLQNSTRGGDLVARLGGDEFALWLDDTDEAVARARAEELLKDAECLKQFSGGPDCPLGMSLGIAVQAPGMDESLEGLMARADEAMYASKNGGKGRYTISTLPSGGPKQAEAR